MVLTQQCGECGFAENLDDLNWVGCCGAYMCDDCKDKHDAKYGETTDE